MAKEPMSSDAVDRMIDHIRKGMGINEYLAGHPEMRKELAPLALTVVTVTETAMPKPDPRFKASLRGRFTKQTATPVIPARTLDFRKLALKTLAASLALIILLGSIAMASTNSMPNSPLYPVKKLVETIRYASATDGDAAVELKSENVQTRLKEAQAMIEEGDQGAAQVALTGLRQDTAEIYRLALESSGRDKERLFDKFVSISERQQAVLAGLLATAPEDARDGLERALAASKHGLENAQQEQSKDKQDKNQPANEDKSKEDNGADGRSNDQKEKDQQAPSSNNGATEKSDHGKDNNKNGR